jgi:hypothetical protein
LVARGLQDLRDAREASRWLRVPAVIVESEVERDSDTDGVSYRPYVSYSYSIEGRSYLGSTLAPGFEVGYAFKRSAASIIQRYPVGARPSSPSTQTTMRARSSSRAAGDIYMSTVLHHCCSSLAGSCCLFGIFGIEKRAHKRLKPQTGQTAVRFVALFRRCVRHTVSTSRIELAHLKPDAEYLVAYLERRTPWDS